MHPRLQSCCQSVCCIPQLYMTTLLVFFAIVNQYTMRVCLNLAITEMVVFPTENDDGDAASEQEATPLPEKTACGKALVVNPGGMFRDSGESVFEWDEATQGLILSAFFWGYVASHFGSAFVADRFPRMLLWWSVFVTAVLTLLTPLAIDIGGAPLLIATRAIEGVAQGATFPVISAIISRWVPPNLRGTLGSFIWSGGQLGSLLGLLGTGFILSELHSWRLVFYIWGLIAMVWCGFWFVVGFDSPETHPFISDNEKNELVEQFGAAKRSAIVGGIPWKRMFANMPFWALVAGQFGHDWGLYLIVTDLPKYMKSTLGFSVAENGLLSSFPYFTAWIFSMLTGWICDVQIKKQCITTTDARKLWTTVGSLLPAIFLMAASYSGCDRVAVVTYFALSVTFMGAFYPGIKVNVNDLSPNFAGLLMALVNGIGAITGVVVPYLAGVMTPNQTIEEWRNVFWIAFWVLNFTNVVFIIYGSGEIQPWNSPDDAK